MDKIEALRLVIDWGFTRFKSWVYDSSGKLILTSSVYTSDLCDTNIFYREKDIIKLVTIIVNLMNSFQTKVDLQVYASSQMHCLAGYSPQFGSFLSTWNDLSYENNKRGEIISVDGIPSLSSMPKFKVDINSLHFSSSYFGEEKVADHKYIEIEYLSSPVALLFSKIFETKLPCSKSWWQSTAIPFHMLGMQKGRGSYLSEKPLSLKSHDIANRHPNLNSVVFFPEVGDLQASTYTAFRNHDIIINLGTGSQVIVANPKIKSDFPFYRYWPKDDNKYSVISHVPCGRLINEYVVRNNMTFRDIKSSLSRLKKDIVIKNAENFRRSILFFPGYCAFEGKYMEFPSTSIEELAQLNIEVLLSLWIYQYRDVIEKLTNDSSFTSRNYLVGITGGLGGMSVEFGTLLEEILPSCFNVQVEDIPLPVSLMDIYSQPE